MVADVADVLAQCGVVLGAGRVGQELVGLIEATLLPVAPHDPSTARAWSSPRFDALWRTVVSEDANLQTAMRRVAETGRAVLTDCDSASITIIERGRPVTVGSTNDKAQALDDAQYNAREGPCLTAAQEGRTIRIDDTGNDERWPRFAASARANGVRSSLSVPIDVSGPDTFAGFNVYGSALGGFSDADEQLCEAFAGQASIVVANAQAYLRRSSSLRT